MSPFDPARYARLLKGLEVSELTLSELMKRNDVFRIDAEYFGKVALRVIGQLDNLGARPLFEQAFVTDGIHTSLPFISGGTVKVLSAKHPKENFIDTSHFERVSDAFHTANPRTALRENDVLISTVGTIGNCAVTTKDLLPANSDRHIGIVRVNPGLSSYFLSTFLLTKYGRTQTSRETTGNVQPNLFISKIKRLLVPRFSRSFEKGMTKLVEDAYAHRKSASVTLEKAEATLLEILGLENWQAPKALSYQRNSKEVFSAGRLDAEHFQPKFLELENRILSTGNAGRLGGWLIHNQRGKQPDYSETGLPVINSKHVLRSEIEMGANNRVAVCANKTPLIHSGDVLINGTGVGTIGRSAAFLHNGKAIPDNHVTVLRPTNGLDPVYLAVFLNSLAGQMQVEQRLHGSSGQIELYPNDIADFQIWIAPEKIQNEIRELVISSYEKKQSASDLLDAAKHAVEIAIEDSEAAAMDYLKPFLHESPSCA